MGYLYIAIALAAGATKGFCGKKTSGFTDTYKDAVLVNMIRMLFCILIGALVMLADGSMRGVLIPAKALAVTAVSGAATSVFVISWLVSVKRGAYTMIDVFLMLGTLIPIALGKILFDEPIYIKTVIGFAVLLVAVVIMCSYNNSIKEKLSPTAFLLLIIAGAANGAADFSQKYFVKRMPDIPISIFNFYTYVFSALTLPVFLVIFKLGSKEKTEKMRGFKTVFLYVLIMSVCLFVNSYFKTAAALCIDSAQLYPLNQGLALVISLVMSAVFFKEKFTLRAGLGAALAFVGLIIINVL